MEKLKSFWQKLNSKLPVLIFDITSIPIAWYLAFLLRYNMQPFPVGFASKYALIALSILCCVQVGCFYHYKTYRGLWRFCSLNDVVRILRAVITATILVIPAFYISSLLHYVPRSVLPLYAIILIPLLCGARLGLRSYWDNYYKSGETATVKHVLIVGAGQAGAGLVRDLKRTRTYVPVGVVDDNLGKRGLEIHGVQVLGTIQDLPKLCIEYNIDLLFIAIPSARSASMRRIVGYCESCNIPFRTLPSLQALVAGRVEVNALREVNLEDLLGRDQVVINWDKIAAGIQGKRVLVTGGGGSIGSELCRQILRFDPQQLLILDNSEFNLYRIEQELQHQFPYSNCDLALVSVVDEIAIQHVFQNFNPEIVFHAASFKHVPMLENQTRVAVQNNVLGTKIVAEASVNFGVEKFILISTDKAVNPSSVMGTTKRVAEIYCQNLNARVPTQFITVRFGNVLGSVGSVVPLFQKQLQHGGPITVTHPDMLRYFMTIAEACQLILQATVNGKGGEIFVLDMGEPVKISYLAEQMIRLSGKEVGKDISIQYIGLRPGEKLFEELFHPCEELVQTEHENLFKAKFRAIEWGELQQSMRLLHTLCESYENQALLVALKNLVPEFQCQTMVSELVDISTIPVKLS